MADDLPSDPIVGLGLGLRWSLLDEIIENADEIKRTVRFFEIAPENYLRRGGAVRRAFDELRALFPILTHGLTLSLGGTDPLDEVYLDEVSAFLAILGPRAWHSDHLCFTSLDGAQLHELLPVPFTREVASSIAARVRSAEERLGVPLALENISQYLPVAGGELSEPEFLRHVLEGCNGRLLLDLNNLYVNAQNHGFDPIVWLENIPLDRVVEIHVAGAEIARGGWLVDTHGSSVNDDVRALLGWVIERTGPLPVLLERDTCVPPLAELLAELSDLEGVYRRALARREIRRGESRVP